MRSDLRALGRTDSHVIMMVSLIHLYQAVMMIMFAAASKATPLLALRDVFNALYIPSCDWCLAVVLIVTAVVAFLGAVMRFGWIRLALFVPQFVILAFQAGGSEIWAPITGRYLDGTIIPWQHIATDQVFCLSIAVLYFPAMLRRARYE